MSEGASHKRSAKIAAKPDQSTKRLKVEEKGDAAVDEANVEAAPDVLDVTQVEEEATDGLQYNPQDNKGEEICIDRGASEECSSAPRTTDSKDIVIVPENFDHYLFHLLLFKAKRNNYHVSREESPELHSWLQYLKREYKLYVAATEAEGKEGVPASSLTADQLKVLESLHIPLTSRGDDHWNRFFRLLVNYKEQHGHVLVPRLCETPGLGDWVTDQRRQYKAWKQGQPSQLNNERREKLSELGFAWHVRNRPEWEQRYIELLDYKAKHGDCKVPQHYKHNRALGKWVAKQREQFKRMKKGQHSFLTSYRLERLNQVGFIWQVRTALDSDIASNSEGDGDNDDVSNPSSSPGGNDGEDKGSPDENDHEATPVSSKNVLVPPTGDRVGESATAESSISKGNQAGKDIAEGKEEEQNDTLKAALRQL